MPRKTVQIGFVVQITYRGGFNEAAARCRGKRRTASIRAGRFAMLQ